MQMTQTFASKALVAVVATAMIFSAFIAPAKAQTAEELQTMINDLMTQMAALQGQGGTSSSVASGICPFTWTRDLSNGATGADVMKLQQFLNSNADTRVAASGAGSVGAETQTYGPLTASAVSKFQVMHRADILTPNGLTNPTGYFGPSTRAKANSLCVTMPTTGTSTTPDEDDEDTDPEELSGEASLTTFEVADGDDADDVEEGSEDVQVGEFTVEFSDGDAVITRLDVSLDGTANTANTEADPWDIFEEISLWVDGEEVARMDASDEDEYLDEDDGSLRFSDLDIVGMEDEEVVIVVAASIVGSVDDANSSTLADWDLQADAIRFVDADDVTTTEETFDDLAGPGLAEFTIDEVGAGDSLDLESSSEDPDAQTLALDEDNNVEAEIFAFELSAEDSDGDIDLNEVVVHVVIATGGATNVDDVVNDFRLEIDGTSYAAESYTGTASSTDVTFDIDGDETVAADAVATAVLFADFEDMETGDEGTTITASTSPANIDAEGSDDVTVGGSTKTGNTHTLRVQGIDLGTVTDGTGSSDSEEVVSGVAVDSNYGTMFLTYEITAFGDNLFVKADNASRGASTTAAVAYTIEDGAGVATTTGAISVSYDIEGADESNGYFELEDGVTYEMTVTVNSFNPIPVGGGTYNLQILTIGFADTEAVADNTQAPADLSDYESDAVAIQS